MDNPQISVVTHDQQQQFVANDQKPTFQLDYERCITVSTYKPHNHLLVKLTAYCIDEDGKRKNDKDRITVLNIRPGHCSYYELTSVNLVKNVTSTQWLLEK